MIETDPVILRFLVIMAGIVITGIGLWLSIKKVGGTAQEAVDLSAPTGNGYAEHTKADLAEIKALIRQGALAAEERDNRIEGKIDEHLGDHAQADILRSRR
jgi:hypothetical protein